VKAVVLVRWHWRDGGWHGHEPSGVVEMEAVGRVQKAQGGWAGPFNNYPNNFQIPPNFEI
jgi:hypothetical protein